MSEFDCREYKNRRVPLDAHGNWHRLQEMVAPPNGEIPVKLKRAPNAFLNLDTAQDWLSHHKKLKEKWIVNEEDLNNDGITDVVVRDKRTREPIIINGWTHARDDFPYRRDYYHLSPAEREGTTYGQWTRDQHFKSKRDEDTARIYHYNPTSNTALAKMDQYRNEKYTMPVALKKRDSGFKVFTEVFSHRLEELFNDILFRVFGKIKIGIGGISHDKFLELYKLHTVRIRVTEKLFPKNQIYMNFHI